MMREVLILLARTLVFGFAITLAAAATYWGLEALLAGYADHDRGLWEGGALVMVINGGHAIVNRVTKQADEKKKKKKEDR